MDLTIHGSPTPRHDRVSSAKSQKLGKGGVVTQPQLNEYTRPLHSRSHGPKPDNVPSLDLGNLADYDNTVSKPLTDCKEKLSPPDTASTVSWGYHDHQSSAGRTIALNTPFALHHTPGGRAGQAQSTRPSNVPRLNLEDKSKQKPTTAWDEPAVPVNIVPPSDRHKQLYKQYQEDMKQQYNQYSKGGAANQSQQPQTKAKQTDPDYTTDEPLNTSWNNSSPSQRREINKKIAAEELAAERMKRHIIQTVLVDQLSRAPISDPEQNRVSTPASSYGCYAQPKKIRNLHETKIKPASSATEKLLAKRLNFSCRVVSRCGFIALRELCGFYFAVDNTMTIYEFRQFGKKASALPFIKRGSYSRVVGRRRGIPYTVQDITRGEELSFETADQPSLPESVQKKPVVILRVTEVDEGAKKDFIFGSSVPYDPEALHRGMNPKKTKQEAEDWKVISKVQNQVHTQIKRRASKTLTGLGKHFKQLDKSGNGTLDKHELQEALKMYHIQLEPQSFEQLWLIIDQNGDGAIDYSEFIRAFIGEMSEYRKHFVIKAFRKIDANKSGTAGIDEVKKFFCAHRHPLVEAGKASEQQVLNDFLEIFGPRVRELTYGDFEDYYEGASIATNSDEEFAHLLKSCWTL